jgi:hypothetical protein
MCTSSIFESAGRYRPSDVLGCADSPVLLPADIVSYVRINFPQSCELLCDIDRKPT